MFPALCIYPLIIIDIVVTITGYGHVFAGQGACSVIRIYYEYCAYVLGTTVVGVTASPNDTTDIDVENPNGIIEDAEAEQEDWNAFFNATFDRMAQT